MLRKKSNRKERTLNQPLKGNEKSPGIIHIPEAFDVIPVRNSVFFPRQILPLSIGREGSLRVVEEAQRENKSILVLAQKDSAIEKPGPSDLYLIGTVARILKVYRVPSSLTS